MLVTSRAHLRRGRAWPCLLQWKSSSNAEFLVVWWIGLLWVSHPETAGHPQFKDGAQHCGCWWSLVPCP